MTAERIAEVMGLLALVEREHPGDSRTGSIPGRVWAPYVEGKGISTVLYSGKGDKGHAYLLACEARNALPELLDAAERAIALQRQVDELRTVIRDIPEYQHHYGAVLSALMKSLYRDCPEMPLGAADIAGDINKVLGKRDALEDACVRKDERLRECVAQLLDFPSDMLDRDLAACREEVGKR